MLVETKRLYIRRMTEGDYDLMTQIWTGWIPAQIREYGEDCGKLFRKLWEDAQSPDTCTGLVFLRDGDRFCGRVNMQHTDQEIPEIGIDLLEDYRGRGYGTEAAAGFANWYGAERHVEEIRVRIAAGNARSAHMFERLGAERVQDGSAFREEAEKLTGALPEKEDPIMQALRVQEYILKLPVPYP